MTRWSLQVQKRFRWGGYGFSRGGHRDGEEIGRSWYLFLPFVVLSLTKITTPWSAP